MTFVRKVWFQVSRLPPKSTGERATKTDDKDEHMTTHQHDKNYVKQQESSLGGVFQILFSSMFCLISLRGRSLRSLLQPASQQPAIDQSD